MTFFNDYRFSCGTADFINSEMWTPAISTSKLDKITIRANK